VGLVSSVAIYFIIWWLVLFAVLPFGVKSQAESGDVTLGTEHGAPTRHFMGRKLLATTLIAAVLFAAIYVAIAVYGVTFEDIMV